MKRAFIHSSRCHTRIGEWQRSECPTRAFSVLELLIIVAVIALIAGVGVSHFASIPEKATEVRTSHNMNSVNRAIGIYLASGGNLDGISDPQKVVEKLKTRRTALEAKKYAGAATGSVIDDRLMFVLADDSKKKGMIRWDGTTKKFVPTQGKQKGSGYFAIATSYADSSPTGGTKGGGLSELESNTEQRDESSLSYSASEGWIWDYNDTSSEFGLNPDQFPTSGVSSSAVPPTPVVVKPPKKPKKPPVSEIKSDIKKVALTFKQLSSSSWALNEAFITIAGKTFRLGNSDMGLGAMNTIEVEVDVSKETNIDIAVFSTPRYPKPSGELYVVGEGFYPVNSFNGDKLSRVGKGGSFSGKGASGAKYKIGKSKSKLKVEIGIEDTFYKDGNSDKRYYDRDYDYDDFRFSITSNDSFPLTVGGDPVD